MSLLLMPLNDRLGARHVNCGQHAGRQQSSATYAEMPCLIRIHLKTYGMCVKNNIIIYVNAGQEWPVQEKRALNS